MRAGLCMLKPRLEKHPLPQTRQEWEALDAPLVREHIPGEACRVIGKVFSWSPLYFDVAILVEDVIVRRKVSKSKVHLTPCDACPSEPQMRHRL